MRSSTAAVVGKVVAGGATYDDVWANTRHRKRVLGLQSARLLEHVLYVWPHCYTKLRALLHRHGALACWDCATAAPHMRVNMNPVVVGADQSLVYKDAIFMSGHKFVGGPGTPGVLVVKRRLLANAVPTVPGGGSVFFVTPTDHRFLRNREDCVCALSAPFFAGTGERGGGLPDLLGVVRLGLAMRLQQQLCALRIEDAEAALCRRALDSLRANPNIVVLGEDAAAAAAASAAAAAAAAAATDAPQPPRRAATGGRLPILSFLIRCGSGGSGGAQQQQQRRGARPLFLHYNFVCALLNDLFGVQARGGCACAGPYAQRLLGLSASAVRALETQLLLKHELLRPGFTRLSLAFFNSEAEVDHILSAVHFVADKGALFLPQYRMNHRTGEWKHVTRANRFPERRWLGNFNFLAAASLRNGATSHPTMAAPAGGCTMNDAAERELLQGVQSAAMAKAQLLERAADINGSAQRPAIAGAVATAGLANHDSLLTAEGEALRWFAYPWERLGGGSGGDAAGVDTVEAVVDPSRYFYTSSQVQAELGWEDSVEWSMIEEGDRLCLGLSGGKDSLALLHVLLDLQRRAPLQRRVLTLKRRLLTVHGIPLPTGSSSISILLLYVAIVCSNAGDTLLTLVRFELACATVDPQTASFDPSPLKPYMAALGVNYHYLSDAIVERARAKLQGDSLCAFCSRAKRGLLYTCCRDNGYNKLVLAQHLDDLAESFMMSFLHNGQTRTMKANYLNDAGDVSIIRPLIYTREVATRDFSTGARLPVINENCPACFEQPKERARVKEMLAREESLYPDMFHCIRQSLVPLMHPSIYAPMQALRDAAADKGKLSSRKARAPSARWAERRSTRAATASTAASSNGSVAAAAEVEIDGAAEAAEVEVGAAGEADAAANEEAVTAAAVANDSVAGSAEGAGGGSAEHLGSSSAVQS
ncbi:hypothetical protein JKP88DRAFT_261266 [Tribonema minus]|uniref:Uncharacterized protein n=1 Tax=Tribonema minus TaxID=303371 RepID=A0A836CDB3_9STRA|nr:hypothetical protein JKP88DRAFT_261266 [Tribonema minus]